MPRRLAASLDRTDPTSRPDETRRSVSEPNATGRTAGSRGSVCDDESIANESPNRVDDAFDRESRLRRKLADACSSSPQDIHDPAPHLSHRTFERRGPARSYPASSRPRTGPAIGGDRTRLASRFRPANFATEIHERLVPFGWVTAVEPPPGLVVDGARPDFSGLPSESSARNDASHVRVDRRDRRAVRQRRDRSRRVRTDPGKPLQLLWICGHSSAVIADDRARGFRQSHGTAVVPEPLPDAHHVGPRRSRECHNGRESAEEPFERRYDASGLRLLEHDLGHEDLVRVVRPPPGVRVLPRLEPLEQGFRERVEVGTLLLQRVMPTIRDVMTSELVTVEPGTTVAEAATIMGAHHVGSALVFGDGGMAGIFTERDILRALASDFDAARHAVEQWMTPHPTTIAADAGLREARDMMLERGFRHLPVLDGDDVVGIVSLRDLSRSDS